jgi:hypothetical protein
MSRSRAKGLIYCICYRGNGRIDWGIWQETKGIDLCCNFFAYLFILNAVTSCNTAAAVTPILLPVILVQNQIIYIIIGKVHTLVQRASVEGKVLGSYDFVYYVERGGHALCSYYGHIAALTSCELCTLCSVSTHRWKNCLWMRRLWLSC